MEVGHSGTGDSLRSLPVDIQAHLPVTQKLFQAGIPLVPGSGSLDFRPA